MQVHSHGRRMRRPDTLADEGADDTAQYVSHTAGCHAGIAGSIDHGHAIISGYDGPGSLQDHDDLLIVALEERAGLARRLESMILDFPDRGIGQTTEFAGMGGEDPWPGRLADLVGMAGQYVQRIGIDDEGWWTCWYRNSTSSTV